MSIKAMYILHHYPYSPPSLYEIGQELIKVPHLKYLKKAVCFAYVLRRLLAKDDIKLCGLSTILQAQNKCTY